MRDQFDVPLTDHDLLDELRLTAELIIAANAAEESLSAEQVDEILLRG